ncbi:MAG TPA: hypothetical protein DCY12_04220 [Candidatus Atribacteria bacterium]|nr:hypothetical protein [Candidatus Atribacteria bacterium]
MTGCVPIIFPFSCCNRFSPKKCFFLATHFGENPGYLSFSGLTGESRRRPPIHTKNFCQAWKFRKKISLGLFPTPEGYNEII